MREIQIDSATTSTADWIALDGVVSETLLNDIDASLAKYGLEVEYCEDQDVFRIAFQLKPGG